MKKILGVIIMSAVVSTGLSVKAGDYPERWNYVSGSILSEESTQTLIDRLQQSARAGCTHVMWVGSRGPRIPELGAEAGQRAGRVRAEAARLGIKMIPGIFSIGYSGRYFHFDSNLAAGVPVKNMPYVVDGAAAAPDPALALDPSALKDTGTQLEGDFVVQPFLYYRVSYRTTAPPGDPEEIVKVTSSDGKRWNSRTNPTVKKDGDGYLVQTVFNTLEGSRIRFLLRPNGGTVSDIRIEPAGMLLILRRPLLPLTVMSEDGKTAYEEGRDFKPVSDPVVTVKPFPGDFFIDHPAPVIELTEDSRIRPGQRLLVSFWHHQRVYSDQDVITLQDPQVWDILELEMKEVAALWSAEGYMLNYDEIRVAGWEPQSEDDGLTPGQILARHFERACALVHKYAPEATIYTWSDMFTPFHNARPFENKGYYYLVNGNWDGSWEGLPPDVVIMNWYAPDRKSFKFFADRGHRQILCGYYDAGTTDGLKQNISHWKRVTAGAPNVQGFMYTTWHGKYERLQEYFELLDTYDEWGKPAGAGEY